MFCRKCGKEIPDDSEFCYKCGTSVTQMTNQEEQIKTQTTSAQNSMELKESLECVDSCIKNLNVDTLKLNFYSVLEHLGEALSVVPPSERQELAEKYCTKLENRLIKLIFERECVFDNHRDNYSMLRGFLIGNAQRDVFLSVALCELSRIPYMSDKFLNELTDFLNSKDIPAAYQAMAACECMTNFKENIYGGGPYSYREYFILELERNYPEFARNSPIVAKLKKRKWWS